MIRFNWDIIKLHTGSNPKKILQYFENVFVLKGAMYEFLEQNKWAKQIYTDRADKNNFLLNIDQLIRNEDKATDEERYVYLDLASRRDYFTYLNTKGTVSFLPIWKSPYEVDKLKLNRLLSLESNNIYFIYEGE
jgi:hypothetical protein